MKKLILSALVVAFVALSLSSCKHTETCPAYGKTTSKHIKRA